MVSYSIEELKKEIEEVFGRKISTARDCNDLSEAIFLKCNERVHANTLRRFFGIVHSPFHASASTLNILARFCGFDSIQDVSPRKQQDDLNEPIFSEKEILVYFYEFFKNTKVTDEKDGLFLSQMEQIINFINRNQHLANKLHKLIAKTKNGQRYYFEKSVNIDKLNLFYGEGLKYYANEKLTREAQIFAHSLLSFRYWLNKDVKNLEKHYNKVMFHKLSETVHPFVCGRYFATQVYYANVTGADTERILINAQKAHGEIKVKNNYKLFPCFEFTFSESLVLTGHYDEALYYLKEATDKYKLTNDFNEKGLYQNLELLKSLAYAKLGKQNEALAIFKRIKPAEFYFLFRKYASILYLLIAIELNRSNNKTCDQLNTLIELTGFSKLQEFSESTGRINQKVKKEQK